MATFAILITAFGILGWAPFWPFFFRFFSWQITKAHQVTLLALHGFKWEGIPDSFKGVKGQFCRLFLKPKEHMGRMQCCFSLRELNTIPADSDVDEMAKLIVGHIRICLNDRNPFARHWLEAGSHTQHGLCPGALALLCSCIFILHLYFA